MARSTSAVHSQLRALTALARARVFWAGVLGAGALAVFGVGAHAQVGDSRKTRPEAKQFSAQQPGGNTAAPVAPLADSQAQRGERAAGDKGAAERPANAKPAPSRGEKTAAGRNNELPAFSPEREAAAWRFVEQNHPELLSVLESLKIASEGEYRKAVVELFRTSERLAQSKERDEQRYELELALWKVHSRIRLLLAQITMSSAGPGGDAEREQQLRMALREQVDLQIQLQELELARAKARLEKLQTNVDTLKLTRDEQVEKLLRQLSHTTENARQRFKKDLAGKSAAKDDAKNGQREKDAAGAASGGKTPANSGAPKGARP